MKSNKKGFTKHKDSQYDAQIIEMYSELKSVIVIGKTLGVTPHFVETRLKLNGVELRVRSKDGLKDLIQYNDNTLLVYIKNYSKLLDWKVRKKGEGTMLHLTFFEKETRMKIPSGNWQLKGNFIESGIEIDITSTDESFNRIVDKPAREIVVLQRVAS